MGYLFMAAPAKGSRCSLPWTWDISSCPPLLTLDQRKARRDKKAFFSDQCKETEENNRTGKTSRDLFKKIRDTKETYHAKIGTIKDRNGMDIIEAEDIKRGGKNTQKNSTKKIFMTKITTMV